MIEYQQGILASVRTQNPMLNEAAAKVQEYTEMCKAGQISKEEYAELVLDVQRAINIQENMADLETMEKLNTAMNGLISIARVV
jgi:polyhydroxyalkanoate synthesis regulator phasin